MAHFIAYQPVNMNKLPGLSAPNTFSPSILLQTPQEVKIEYGNFIFDFKSLPSHRFTFDVHHHLTGGVVGSFEMDTTTSGSSPLYRFTGLDIPVSELASHDAHILLAGNDTITGSHGNDVLIGGPDNNTFVFTKPFGHDVIANFSVNDKIRISHTIFANFEAVQDAAHVDAHHHVVITVDASDTITLNTVHHVSDLTASEFLFI